MGCVLCCLQGIDEGGLDYALNRAIDAYYNDRQWFRSLQVSSTQGAGAGGMLEYRAQQWEPSVTLTGSASTWHGRAGCQGSSLHVNLFVSSPPPCGKSAFIV